MKLEQAIAAVKAAIQARVPVLLWGPPGIGKTEIIGQIADDIDAGFVSVAVSTRPPEEFSGLPIPTERGVEQRPMSWLVRAIELAESRPGGCIVLLDEFSTAPPATQAAMLSLVQSRYCGDTEIPRSVAWVAAANPARQAANGWALPAPTVSRWAHVPWPAPTVEDWSSWLVGRSIKPEDAGKPWAGPEGDRARSLVVGFLTRRPSHLLQDPPPQDGEHGYPCPRSWEHAARAIAAVDGDEVARDILVSGCVGPGVAGEFAAWVREADLPDPEDVLANPESWSPYPGRADRTVAVLLSVVAAVISRPDQPRYDAGLRVCVRAAEGGAAGASVMAARRLVQATDSCGFRPPTDLARLLPLLREAGVLK